MLSFTTTHKNEKSWDSVWHTKVPLIPTESKSILRVNIRGF